MRHAQHDILFEPMQVGTKVFRNRFYSVPHASFVVGRRMSDIGFRRMKAEGGWAAVCGGVTSIRPDSWGGLVPRIWDPVDREVLQRMSDEIKGQGALSGIELGHGGARGEGSRFGPSLAASPISDPERGPAVVPKAMSVDEIHMLQADWLAASHTAAEIGYDIIYTYGGHGTLPAQFLSPYFNKRTDEYGGSLENRARFWLEMMQGLRDAVGPDCIIAARVAADTLSPYGMSAEDSIEFIRMADEYVDLWDVNIGHAWDEDSAPWRHADEGSQLAWTSKVRQLTAKPIVGVSRLTNPDLMADIVRSGAWDFIGGARPGIADPFLPNKVRDGRYEDIRECTGGNYCIAIETGGMGLGCVQNPTIGEEYRRGWHPERFEPARDPHCNILVVGAGPAGLECARVLGERGFDNVHLVDANDEVGGHQRWTRRLPGLGGFGRIVDYRVAQLAKLDNVHIVRNTKLTASDILDYGADVVVLANGADWIGVESDLHGFPLAAMSAAGLQVLTPEAIMIDGAAPDAERVVVWDSDGAGIAAGLAEKLCNDGFEVTIATAFASVAPRLDLSFEGGLTRQRLHELGVTMLTGVLPLRFDGGCVVLANGFGEESTLSSSAMVVVAQRLPDESLFDALDAERDRLVDAGIRHLLRIGDCVAPRAVGNVVSDGHRLGRELDSETPQFPREPIREDDHDVPTASFTAV